MSEIESARRHLLMAAGMAGAGLLAGTPAIAAGKQDSEEKPVGAVEDLMREHGVLRRALLVYRESALRLRRDAGRLDPGPLARTAGLFRNFGEDYHEKKLEEAHIFPALRKLGGPGAAYVDVLIAQHRRGREITDYVLAVAKKGRIGTAQAEPLARALESLDLMYENHAAREDTIVFPAWKQSLSERQLREMGEKFEDIERQQFGKDGFDEAVKEIAAIEQALGFSDLAQFTAAPPQRV